MPVLTLPSPDSATARAKALVFEDEQSRALLRRIEMVAPSDATILLCGETGTGKEIVARHVHELSTRRGRPFVGVNSGALPEALVESELFGHERGAFNGAVQSKAGWFETAHGGTLFLDEIGDIPLATQVKLLRVLQEGEAVPLGARTAQRVDVRLIAATNVDLLEAVRAGHPAAGALCEIVNDDGSMARLPELHSFAARHGFLVVSIADLIAYRLRTEAWSRPNQARQRPTAPVSGELPPDRSIN
jgi:transcriptional regulator with AAA-type ATPase domain